MDVAATVLDSPMEGSIAATMDGWVMFPGCFVSTLSTVEHRTRVPFPRMHSIEVTVAQTRYRDVRFL
jgi:hypothetical protein